jgi:hypothetical protein
MAPCEQRGHKSKVLTPVGGKSGAKKKSETTQKVAPITDGLT